MPHLLGNRLLRRPSDVQLSALRQEREARGEKWTPKWFKATPGAKASASGYGRLAAKLDVELGD